MHRQSAEADGNQRYWPTLFRGALSHGQCLIWMWYSEAAHTELWTPCRGRQVSVPIGKLSCRMLACTSSSLLTVTTQQHTGSCKHFKSLHCFSPYSSRCSSEFPSGFVKFTKYIFWMTGFNEKQEANRCQLGHTWYCQDMISSGFSDGI